jgi:deoxyribodipyrimidine photo-lyase
MTDDGTILVWHRTDLRVRDNPALDRATALARDNEATIQPVFVFDPRFYGSKSLACDGRIAFLHECLSSLREQYRERGAELAFLHGEPAERFGALLRRTSTPYSHLCYTRHPTARYGARRDDELRSHIDDGDESADFQRCRTTIEAVPEGAIVFDAQERGIDSREGWAEQCEEYLRDECYLSPDPDVLVSETNAPASDVTIKGIEARYEVDPVKRDVPRGTHRAAHRRLDWFARAKTIDQYPGGISPPAQAEQRTSRLSPYLRFGVLSARQVYRAGVERGGAERARDLFESRLYWNRHFRQKLADNPTLTREAVNPVLRGLYTDDEHDPELVAAWKEGRTGFPMVDASMRALTETGWLNFRMRAMIASFFGYVLKQWWRIGADFMYFHLIDADPAINYAQWQMQCGLVGCHPNRVYNPRKQARENDPDGEFVRAYVPELRDLPTEFLARPERAPVHVQHERDTTIGDGPDADYPYPVVDFDREATLAREQFSRLADQARAALDDPDVRRRASLSRNRRRRMRSEATNGSTVDEQSDGGNQHRLGEF